MRLRKGAGREGEIKRDETSEITGVKHSLVLAITHLAVLLPQRREFKLDLSLRRALRRLAF